MFAISTCIEAAPITIQFNNNIYGQTFFWMFDNRPLCRKKNASHHLVGHYYLIVVTAGRFYVATNVRFSTGLSHMKCVCNVSWDTDATRQRLTATNKTEYAERQLSMFVFVCVCEWHCSWVFHCNIIMNSIVETLKTNVFWQNDDNQLLRNGLFHSLLYLCDVWWQSSCTSPTSYSTQYGSRNALLLNSRLAITSWASGWLWPQFTQIQS